MIPSGTHHVAIKVADLARAEAFYAGVLGLRLLRRWPASDGLSDRSVWLDLGGGAFLALERSDEAQPAKAENASGIHLLALHIRRADRQAWIARLAESGHAIYQHTDYTIYVKDPEGNRIGLSHWGDDG